jgi:hypothetical protein
VDFSGSTAGAPFACVGRGADPSPGFGLEAGRLVAGSSEPPESEEANSLALPLPTAALLKAVLVYITFKNPVRTAKKTLHFTVTKVNWLTLFKEIIAVYTVNDMKNMSTKFRLVNC